MTPLKGELPFLASSSARGRFLPGKFNLSPRTYRRGPFFRRGASRHRAPPEAPAREGEIARGHALLRYNGDSHPAFFQKGALSLTPIGIVLALTTALCWAIVPLIYRRNMGDLSFPEVNAIRSFGFVGAMVLLVLFQGTGMPPALRGPHFLLLLAATLLGNVFGDVLYLSSIAKIGVGRAVAITSTYPLVVTVLSALWLGERITLPIAVGTVSVVAGLNLLRKGNDDDRGHLPEAKRGFLLALATALCWGLSIPVTRWLLLETDLSSMDLNFWRSLVFFPSVWALWLLRCRLGYHRPERILALKGRSWLALNGAGALALALGGTLLALALQRAPASVVTPITASSPLVSTLLAILFLGETSTRRQWAGIVLVVVGSAIISF